MHQDGDNGMSLPGTSTGDNVIDVTDQYIPVPACTASEFEGDPYASFFREPIDQKVRQSPPLLENSKKPIILI